MVGLIVDALTERVGKVFALVCSIFSASQNGSARKLAQPTCTISSMWMALGPVAVLQCRALNASIQAHVNCLGLCDANCIQAHVNCLGLCNANCIQVHANCLGLCDANYIYNHTSIAWVCAMLISLLMTML